MAGFVEDLERVPSSTTLPAYMTPTRRTWCESRPGCGYEQYRRADIGPEAADEVEYLSLHSGVESGGLFIKTSSSGSDANAMAITTRWSMPPDS